MIESLLEYYKCPEEFFRFAQSGPYSSRVGYFQFGGGTLCFGSYVGRNPSADPSNVCFDALHDVEFNDHTIRLPFDPSEVVNNLRCETYAGDWRNKLPISALARIYYFLRPILPVSIRKHLQEFHFRGWNHLKFPNWPVDCTVDNIHSQLLTLTLQYGVATKIPFIWFWPKNFRSCAIVTHDVETEKGSKLCETLMDIDDSFGIKASFEVIPEKRYSVTTQFLASVRNRGFEIVIHDLNHDGHLYRDRKEFLNRAARINSYAAQYGAEGFRAATLYRKQLWFDALKFSYDMSVPNVAHLDPQPGGCCTVMPYFLGNILELPVTTTQDYTLFHILNDYSIDLWKKQIEIIMSKHGLISFIVHPDYIFEPRQCSIYKSLLALLSCLREGMNLWITTPGEVNRWWRQRAGMRLVPDEGGWRIDGAGSEYACIAYATLEKDRLVYSLDEKPTNRPLPHPSLDR